MNRVLTKCCQAEPAIYLWLQLHNDEIEKKYFLNSLLFDNLCEKVNSVISLYVLWIFLVPVFTIANLGWPAHTCNLNFDWVFHALYVFLIIER